MAKFNNLGALVGGDAAKLASGAPAGGGFFKDLNNSIIAFRDVLKLAQELRGNPPATGPAVTDKLPNYPPPKSIQAAPNPALGKFLAEYGDTTIDEALKILKPMTIKQVIAMVQYGTRPGK